MLTDLFFLSLSLSLSLSFPLSLFLSPFLSLICVRYLPTDPVTGATTDSDWSEKNIAWVSDRETKFKLPTVASANWNYKDDVDKGVSSDYYHLYQMYPSFPHLKEEGLTNEHFIVWMRTAGLPTFRKLYVSVFENVVFKLYCTMKYISYSSLLLHIFTVSLEYSFFSTFFGNTGKN